MQRHQPFEIAVSKTSMDDATRAIAWCRSRALVNAERDADRQRYNDIINRNQDAIFKLREQKTELSVSIKQLEADWANSI